MLSRSESPESSPNDADGESSEALVDSSGRPIEYYRKNKRGAKYHARRQEQPSYGEEDDYDEINLGRDGEEEYEDEESYDS